MPTNIEIMSAPERCSEEERKIHEGFMREALNMAELALKTDETPVGCVFVHNGQIVARGMNATNRTLNGTRHAEFMAINSMLRRSPKGTSLFKATQLREMDLYVTIEPCVMCASLLRQYGVRHVYFGAANERFGGTGGVFHIHDCRSVDPPYEVSGGWCREEAIMLLRRFYVQENEKAPEPNTKGDRVLKTAIEPIGKKEEGEVKVEGTPIGMKGEEVKVESEPVVKKARLE